MADLLPQLDYSKPASEAAAIPGAMAQQWADASNTQATATKLNLRNKITKMAMPLIQSALEDPNGIGQDQNYGSVDPYDASGPAINKDDAGSDAQATSTEAAPQLAGGSPAPANQSAAAGAGPVSPAASPPTSATSSGPPEGHNIPGHPNFNLNAHMEGLAAKAFTPLQNEMPAFINGKPNKMFQIVQGYTLSGDPELMQSAENLKSNYTTAANSENQKRKQQANEAYATAQDIVGAPSGKAWDILKQQNPKEYAQLRAIHPKWSDQDLRDNMTAAGGAAFMYSGRGINVLPDGRVVDATSNKQILNNKTRVGLTPGENAQVRQWAMGDVPVTIGGNGFTAPRYSAFKMLGDHRFDKYLGGNMPESSDDLMYAITKGLEGNDPAVEQYAKDNNYPPSGTPSTAATPQISVPAKGQSGPVATPMAGGGSVKSGTGHAAFDPVTHQASNFDAPANVSLFPKNPSMIPDIGTPNGVQTANAQMQPAALQKEISERGSLAIEAQSGIANDQKMLSILPDIHAGPASPALNKFQAFTQEFGASLLKDYNDPAKWAVLNKMLGASATDRLRAGATAGMNDQDGGQTRVSGLLYKIGMESLSANTSIPKDAIKNMLMYDIANRTYTVKSSHDFANVADKNPNMNPNAFPGEYSRQFPVEKVLPDYMGRMTGDGTILPRFKGNMTLHKSNKTGNFVYFDGKNQEYAGSP